MNVTLSRPVVQVGGDERPEASPTDEGQRDVRESAQEPAGRSRPLDQEPTVAPDAPDGREPQVTEPSWPWSWLTPSR